MNKRMAIVEWTDKHGIIHRTAPMELDDTAAMKRGARQACEAMCQPVPREVEMLEDGNFIVLGEK